MRRTFRSSCSRRKKRKLEEEEIKEEFDLIRGV